MYTHDVKIVRHCCCCNRVISDPDCCRPEPACRLLPAAEKTQSRPAEWRGQDGSPLWSDYVTVIFIFIRKIKTYIFAQCQWISVN